MTFRPRQLDLRARLFLLVVAIAALVASVIAGYLFSYHVGEAHTLVAQTAATLRADLRTKGMALVRSAALSSQRAIAVSDFLFLVEVIDSTVQHDNGLVYSMLMDRQRKVLVHSNRQAVDAVLSDPADLYAAQATAVTTQEIVVAGKPVLDAIAPVVIGTERWGTLRFGLSMDSLNNAITDAESTLRARVWGSVLVTLFLTATVVSVAVVIGATSLRRTVLQPMATLLEGVQHLEQGDLHHAVVATGSAEFVSLGEAFNRMSTAIARRDAAVKNLNAELLAEVEQRRKAQAELKQANEGLEERVQERTSALRELNQSLAAEVASRRQAEEELRQVADELRNSNQALTEFAYIASHDLQEPLRKVQTFGDRLKSHAGPLLDERALDYLERMLNAVVRMRGLINGLLAYSRATANNGSFCAVDLNAIIREVLSDLEVTIEAKSARVSVQTLPTIEGDPLQIRQLFQNLLSNALKFQAPGSTPVVAVTCRAVSSDGGDATPATELDKKPEKEPDKELDKDADSFELAVSDNGVGFEAEKYEPKLFGVFQRFHTRTEFEGTGIGLAVCRKIAARHHGSISVVSAPGAGTTFRVTLPRKVPDTRGAHHN